jgi:Muramidase (flagellum-specific)
MMPLIIAHICEEIADKVSQVCSKVVFLHLISEGAIIGMKKYILAVLVLFAPVFLFAQGKMTTEAYIEKYKGIAISKMQEYHIPASITLAQGILESGSGNSELALNARNHFGIKCHKGWTGDTYTMDDDEKNECFRKYNNAEDSYRDHSLFLTSRDRYKSLFDLDETDYASWAKGLKASGYATNPRYPELLIGIIERYNLSQYDQIALGNALDDELLESEKDAGEFVADDVTSMDFDANKVYSPDDKSGYAIVDKSNSGRFIYENNDVKFVFAKDGDTPYSIAEEIGVYSHQIFNYNYLDRDAEIVFDSGDIIYIEPLKNKSKTQLTYTVKPHETLRDVALKFGVKVSKLQKINKMKDNVCIPAGRTIKLRRH